ncbi:MAG: glycerophosphodiester phosphodiesterase family protein [Rhodothermales bacterium]|nr:glycerophosphodiester phosphodiesterase family protein [Rhodothermales bacterium]
MKTHLYRRGLPLAACLLIALSLPACKTGQGTTGRSAPAYARAAEHFRHFADADELAAYLRHGSDAGPLISAHRGGPTPGFPENCIETFDRVLRLAPALLEVDVRMTSDSILVLMHDETLGRTSTGEGRVAERTLDDIRSELLRDPSGIITPFRVPTLAEVLAWSRARAILTLDVKPGLPADLVIEEIRRHNAENRAVVIVYSIPDLMAFARRAPDLIYSVPAESEDEISAILDTGVAPAQLIVWMGVGEVRPDVIRRAHALGIRVMMGTFGEIDDRAVTAGPTVYENLLQAGVDVIATDRVADAAEAVANVSAFSDG